MKIWEVVYPWPGVELHRRVETLSLDARGTLMVANGTLWQMEKVGPETVIRAMGDRREGELVSVLPDGRVLAVDLQLDPNPDTDCGLKQFRLLEVAPKKAERILQLPKLPPPPPHNGVAGRTEMVWLPESIAFDSGAQRLALTGKVRHRWENMYVEGYALAVWGPDLASPPMTAFTESVTYGAERLDFSPDGKLIASVRSHGYTCVWDALTLKRLHLIDYKFEATSQPFGAYRSEKHSGGLDPPRVFYSFGAHCVRFSRDGSRVFSAEEAGHINVGDPRTGKQVANWEGHHGDVFALAVSPDGQTIASGGKDRTVRLWEIATGRELACWQGHDGSVTALAYSSDGTVLASGDSNGSVKLWELPFIRRELGALGLDW